MCVCDMVEEDMVVFVFGKFEFEQKSILTPIFIVQTLHAYLEMNLTQKSDVTKYFSWLCIREESQQFCDKN